MCKIILQHERNATCYFREDEKNARGGFEEPPSGIDSFANFERTEAFRTKLLESDVII